MNHIRFRAVIDSREGFEHNGNAWCVRWNKVTVTVAETPGVSQPNPFSDGETVEVPRTDLTVDIVNSDLALVHESVSLDELVNGLNSLGISPPEVPACMATGTS